MNNLFDHIIEEIDRGLKYSTQNFQSEKREYPAKNINSEDLNEIEKYHSAGLMRVNHSGEVCAQALYRGQALTAKLKGTRDQMEKAAEEELDHLAWCNKRLEELGQSPSKLSPLWYGMSFTLGAVAGAAGDEWSLGFVEETEDQVVKHLEGHMKNVSKKDTRTLAIMDQMKSDEEAHGKMAHEAGAAELPSEVKELMGVVAKIMTKTSYEF
jgi:ubiquinone biosynthesis monooxygenase Coq7|tara:strand:- start:6862 stop:7494 length:633 start_codon:yes stop_codon:yes gene_type:complete